MNPDRPHLVGDGPASASTSLVLVLRPIWDVNGWYRDLGVDPRASRSRLKRAYAESRRDAHLTHVIKMLLNPAVRAEYDACPLGTLYLDDEVLAWIRSQRVHFVRGVSDLSDTLPASVETEPFEVVDARGREGQDRSNDPATWGWSYYLWDTSQADLTGLARWQTLLVSALGRSGVVVQIAVGAVGGDHPPVVVTKVGARIVAFLHEQYSTTDAPAQQAVSQVAQDVQDLLDDGSPTWASSVPVPKPHKKRARAPRSPRRTTSPSRTAIRSSSGS